MSFHQEQQMSLKMLVGNVSEKIRAKMTANVDWPVFWEAVLLGKWISTENIRVKVTANVDWFVLQQGLSTVSRTYSRGTQHTRWRSYISVQVGIRY